jgi:Bifunctional DNA primase/polymerase, N-terminal/CHC2 zinc finger
MSRSPSDQLMQGALGLAARGVPVIPLRPRSKVPIHRGWPALGMLDPDAICTEWRLNPGANVAVLCGPDAFCGDGLVVIDIDLPDGPYTWFDMLGDRPTPDTAAVRTPSGGQHLYFTGHAGSWNPGPGVEVRSIGRQCAAPPSFTGDGRYTWIQETILDVLPEWLCKPPELRRTPRAVSNNCPSEPSEPSEGRDPVLAVDPPTYFRTLTGLVPNRQGFVLCPVHQELEPSCKVYETADRGWFCFGCRAGGDVVTLVAQLAGIPTPVKGREFLALLDYLAGRLL